MASLLTSMKAEENQSSQALFMVAIHFFLNGSGTSKLNQLD